MTATLTFLGGPDAGGVDSMTWGNDATGMVTFPLREPVVIDPATAKTRPEREFLEHIIKKAAGNRFFKVEEGAVEGRATKATVKKATPRPRKNKASEDA